MIKEIIEYLVIKKSKFFDPSYYIIEYPDCRRADVDPLWHYVKIGWREGRNPSPKFDSTYYLTQYPDVRESKTNPLVHYIKYGINEGRSINHQDKSNLTVTQNFQTQKFGRKIKNAFLRIGLKIYRSIPLRYRPKLHEFIGSHFHKLHTEIINFQYRSGTIGLQNSEAFHNQLIDFDFVEPAKKSNGKIAIHIHVFYEDLAKEISEYLTNMPFQYDLFISVSNENSLNICQTIFENLSLCNNLEIKIAPNRGRDIAPFICLFGKELQKYDYIAHLHTKKSVYNNNATLGWREYLFESLLGSKEQIQKILNLLDNNKNYGIIYPQNYVLLPYWANTWLANKESGRYWLSRLGINIFPKGYFDFPASSMFWAKSFALDLLFNAGITFEDFPVESGQNDGTLAHTIERLFVLCCNQSGFQPGIIKDATFTSWSSWRFDQYLNRETNSLLNLLRSARIKLIGFDIFDTLFTRPLLEPESIKEIVALNVEPQVGQIYRKFRGIAESQARQIKGMDVDLNEIFIQFKIISELSDEDVDKLKTLEINIEELLLSPRAEGIQLFQEAIRTQKPVSILSDMFLPKEVIKDILIQNNIKNWDMLLISSDIGIRKDTKQLYDYVLNHYGFTPDQFLMVGDNERSDIQIPCDMESSFIHLLKPVELARGLPRFSKIIEQHENNWDINAELTLGLVIQKNFSKIDFSDSLDINSLIEVNPYNYGYSLIGPLLVSFSNWLIEQSKEHGIDRYYFLSREGKLFKDVFDCWTENLPQKPRSYYMVISRRAAGVAALEEFSDILEIAKTTYFPNTIGNFLFTRFGVRLDENRWDEIRNKIGWSSQQEISVYDKNIEDLVPILHEVEEDIYNRGKFERLGLLEYLKRLGLQKDENQAVVDVGYGGSVQSYLNSLLGNKVHGLYLLTDDRAKDISKNFDVKLFGCFYENVDRKNNPPTMYKLNFDLEKLLSSKEPQIEYYELIDNFEIVGRYRDLEALEISANVIRDEIRKGALDYTIDAVRIREKILPTFSPSIWSSKLLIESLLVNPSKNEVDFLSKIVLDDYYCGRGLVT